MMPWAVLLLFLFFFFYLQRDPEMAVSGMQLAAFLCPSFWIAT